MGERCVEVAALPPRAARAGCRARPTRAAPSCACVRALDPVVDPARAAAASRLCSSSSSREHDQARRRPSQARRPRPCPAQPVGIASRASDGRRGVSRPAADHRGPEGRRDLPGPVDRRADGAAPPGRRSGARVAPRPAREAPDARRAPTAATEPEKQEDAADPQLGGLLQRQRVRVADEQRNGRMLRPPVLVAPSPDPRHGGALEGVDRLGPELPAPVRAQAGRADRPARVAGGCLNSRKRSAGFAATTAADDGERQPRRRRRSPPAARSERRRRAPSSAQAGAAGRPGDHEDERGHPVAIGSQRASPPTRWSGRASGRRRRIRTPAPAAPIAIRTSSASDRGDAADQDDQRRSPPQPPHPWSSPARCRGRATGIAAVASDRSRASGRAPLRRRAAWRRPPSGRRRRSSIRSDRRAVPRRSGSRCCRCPAGRAAGRRARRDRDDAEPDRQAGDPLPPAGRLAVQAARVNSPR